jgi:hypothetical protein
MESILKYTAAATLAGALALAAATSSEARNGRNTAAAIGFGAGALVGAAVVGNGYYGPRYYSEPGYTYESEPVYVEPAPRRYYRSGARNSCWYSTGYRSGYYGAC